MDNTLREKETAIFETLPIPRAVAALAVPTIISQIIAMIYNLADTWYIGQTGNTDMLAAVTIAWPLFMLTTAMANLFGIGGGSSISRALGQKDYNKAKQASSFSFWTAIAVTLLFSAVVVCTRKHLLVLLGADEATFAFSYDYLFWVVVIGGVPTVLNMLLAHLVRAVGESKQASIGMSLGGILNIILDPVFMFEWGLGLYVKGAAMATCLSNTIASCYLLRFIIKGKHSSVLSLSPKYFTLRRDVSTVVLSTGIPSALQTFLVVVSNAVLNNLMSAYTTAAVAAVGIIKKADIFPVHVVQGLSNGVLPLMAYNYASSNRRRMNRVIRFSLIVSSIFTVICLICYELFAPFIVSIFINDEVTIGYGASFMRLHSMAMPFLSVIFLLIAFFQATAQSKQAIIISLLRKGIIDIPLMIVMDRLLPMLGIMIVQPVMDFSCTVIALVMFLSFTKRLRQQEIRGT